MNKDQEIESLKRAIVMHCELENSIEERFNEQKIVYLAVGIGIGFLFGLILV